MQLKTERLMLNLQSPEEVLAWVATLPDDVRSEISPAWLQRLELATGPDPFACMFKISLLDDPQEIGSCGFKGPPDDDGMVEIAYAVDQPMQGNGYATEAADAIVQFASDLENVSTVRAHTKSDNPASQRILTKLGFQLLGPVEDPEDGTVNRWEINAR